MKKALLSLCILGLSTSAFAQHQITVQGGFANVDGESTSSHSGEISQWGYNHTFMPNIAWEVAYFTQDGDFEGVLSHLSNRNRTNFKGGLVGAKGSLPIFSFLEVYADAGLNYASLDYIEENSGVETTTNHTGFNPYFGVGIEFLFGEQFGLTLSYQGLILPGDYTSNNTLLGLAYRF